LVTGPQSTLAEAPLALGSGGKIRKLIVNRNRVTMIAFFIFTPPVLMSCQSYKLFNHRWLTSNVPHSL